MPRANIIRTHHHITGIILTPRHTYTLSVLGIEEKREETAAHVDGRVIYPGGRRRQSPSSSRATSSGQLIYKCIPICIYTRVFFAI